MTRQTRPSLRFAAAAFVVLVGLSTIARSRRREKLPFDQHWFLALAAPRPFIALEGDTDTISLPEAVRQSILGARPAYTLFGVPDRVGVNYSKHGHAFTTDDWRAMMDFSDRNVRGKKVDRTFDRFPETR